MASYKNESREKTVIKRTWMDTPLLRKNTTLAMKQNPLLNGKEKDQRTQRHTW